MGGEFRMQQVELWLLYMKGLQKLGQLWSEPLWQSLELVSRAMSGDALAVTELTNFYRNIYDIHEKTFGSFLQTPSLGYSREFNHKLFKSVDSWINVQKTSFDYQLLLIDVWARAFEELMRELVSSEEKGETLQNWRQSLQVWSRVFDRVFAQTFRSEDALQNKGKFLNAAITYKLHQQQLIEVFLKMNDLPTRSEVDEIHRSIYELRKEIKTLKKFLAESPSK